MPRLKINLILFLIALTAAPTLWSNTLPTGDLEPIVSNRTQFTLQAQIHRLIKYTDGSLSSAIGANLDRASQQNAASQWVVAKKIELLLNESEEKSLTGLTAANRTHAPLIERVSAAFKEGLLERFANSLAIVNVALRTQGLTRAQSEKEKMAQGLAVYDTHDEYLTYLQSHLENEPDTSTDAKKTNSDLLSAQLTYFANLASATPTRESIALKQTQLFVAMWSWSESEKSQALGWFAIINKMRESNPMASTEDLVIKALAACPLGRPNSKAPEAL